MVAQRWCWRSPGWHSPPPCARSWRPSAAPISLLTGSYTLWLRNIAVADIAAVAGGFVLRALAGGVATSVTVSRWFMIVTSFGALFLVAGKRYAELLSERRRAGAARTSTRVAASVLGAVSALRDRPRRDGHDHRRTACGPFSAPISSKLSWYELTIIPFVLWLLRYALLLDGGEGQAPEELVAG